MFSSEPSVKYYFMNCLSAEDKMFPIYNFLQAEPPDSPLLTHEYQEGGDEDTHPHDAEY